MMQIQPTYEDRVMLLDEINNLNDSCNFVYNIRFHRFIFDSDEYHATTRVYQYLLDLIAVKWMIYRALNVYAVDS